MSEYKKKGGEVLHCPKCGEIVPESAAVCPVCGFEFSQGANTSSIILANMLAAVDDDDKKCQIIETFPLPTNKADILEFVTELKPRIQNTDSYLADSYMVKYQALIEKIKANFSNDKQLMPFVQEFPALQAAIEAKKKKQNRQDWFSEHSKLIVVAVVLIIALLVGGGLMVAFRDTVANNAELCIQAVNNSVNKDNLKQARNFIMGYKHDKDDIMESYVTLLSKYFDEGKWDEAKSLVEFYGNGQYTGDLNRGLFNYLMATGEYDQAEEYINVEAKPSDEEYYAYIEEAVTLMCKAGLVNPAQEFVAKKALHFASNRAGYYAKDRVQARLQKIIDAYK